MNSTRLTQSEQLRYSRHLLLPEIGFSGQERIKAARVLLIGAGGLGSPAILYLAAAGIGTIGVVDFDRVELSNLQRQIVFRDIDTGSAKVEKAVQHAHALNPTITLQPHELKLSSQNAAGLIADYDVIIDGSDNFATRYLVNDACVLQKKPNIYGSVYRFDGQASVFSYRDGPCYRCLFPEPPSADATPNCAEAGVLGVIPGIIGCIQAAETLKIIIERGESLSGRLLLFDALSMSFDTLPLLKDPNCPVCGVKPTITELKDLGPVCSNTSDSASVETISPVALKELLKSNRKIVLLDVRTDEEVAICRIEKSMHVPLASLKDHMSELDHQAEIVTYCKTGVRSAKAAAILIEDGFPQVRSLAGGILAWTRDVDQSLQIY